MNFTQLATLVFFIVIVGFLAIAGLLGIFIVIKYGRTRAVTTFVSALFAIIFAILTLSTLTTIFQIS